MPLAHAHKLFITFNLTIRISGVTVRTCASIGKEMFAQERHSGRKERASGTLLGLRVRAKDTGLFVRTCRVRP